MVWPARLLDASSTAPAPAATASAAPEAAGGTSQPAAAASSAAASTQTARDAAELSVLGRYVATVLENETEARSALPGLVDRLRTTAVAAVFDVVTRAQLAEPPAVSELARTLADFALRLLR